MLGNSTYANKKRKKPVLKQKKNPENNEVVKSNPSKRHRDRLNGELDRLMDLLPFPEDVRFRLDKLSVLRLSVGYLRVKTHFKATMKTNGNGGLVAPVVNRPNGKTVATAGFSEGELLLQAMNGFVMVVSCDGLVFYSSPTIKDYLGFHQSDVVHQSVFDLIHTDDRGLFREQLHFALNPPPIAADGEQSQGGENAVIYNPEQLPPENSSFLERSFVCRFRCLLDNSSGFLALKFQGRLKYIHSQNLLRENGSCNRPQLALFSVAMPVQPPSIVEIRTKMLLFQTKHKLDFTPMSVDSRGKLILGYTETELCTRGSGYQFIHAADMMYCADNHMRMIKTGETGLTVFRLLSKSGAWVWTKSNAKLIFKGGRPDFIIAYQRALSNAEGEEYLRQRRLQLPFNCTMGEAILYDTGPTVDVSQYQYDKMFNNKEVKTDMAPGSLLDCFLRQDESVYTQAMESPLSVDQLFTESHALFSVASGAWPENQAGASTGEPAGMKDEDKQSVMAVIDTLEKLTENGDFDALLQNLEVDDGELMEWENEFKRLRQEEDQLSGVTADLDAFIVNDIVDYIDDMFKEKVDCLSTAPSSCIAGVADLAASQLCEPPVFQTPAQACTFPPVNGLYAHQQGAANGAAGPAQGLPAPAQMDSRSQKLSHQGPLLAEPDCSLPPLQQLQLKDIFSPSVELPELTIPNISADDGLAAFPSCQQASMGPVGFPQAGSVQVQQPNQILWHQNGLQAGGGHLLQRSAQQPQRTAPAGADALPPLVPCNNFSSSSTSTVPVGFPRSCLQENLPFKAVHNGPLQPWPQSQQQKLPHAGLVQPMQGFKGPSSEGQTLPCAGSWPRGVNGLNATERGGVAGGQAAPQSSCMYQQHFSSAPAGGAALPHAGLGGTNISLNQNPPQGSRYLQWSRGEPTAGGAVLGQESAGVGPLAAPPSMLPTEHSCSIQHYLDNNAQTQSERVFVEPALDIAAYLME
ncbi:aryl hydrocarbon receptor-like isoform X2 [Cololabis saira]|uniref:aryl hydrocarbon receptor-like isoform X2 n=1 Tax=Cololabis saira TaxID=129043 RepID=UPI002AD2B72C|nr:aryl hydrocarbon receptor-like isoform X2 [Cololabis saira]